MSETFPGPYPFSEKETQVFRDFIISKKVLQSDGSNYCACVNAATLAIIDAGIPIKDYVCACSVSLVRDTPLIDMNHLEESSGSPYISLALLPNYDQIVLMESASRMHVDYLDKMIESAMVGCKDMYAVFNKYVIGIVV